MASGEHPSGAHHGEAPPDDEEAPPEARASDEEPLLEDGAAGHEARDEGEPRDKRGRLEQFIPDIVQAHLLRRPGRGVHHGGGDSQDRLRF